jgi:DNA-binding PadR family transcriptional regulator
MSPAVFGHGHLRLYLLSLLDEEPRHGYELIQALESRFGGTYVPSAGTIYPRLAKLVDEGLITKREDGRRSVYDITEAGRQEVRARAGELDGIESELSDSVRRLADEVRSSVNQAMKTLRADLAADARDARASPSGSRAAAGCSRPRRRSPSSGPRCAPTSVAPWSPASSLQRRSPSCAPASTRCAVGCGKRSRTSPGGRLRAREPFHSGP